MLIVTESSIIVDTAGVYFDTTVNFLVHINFRVSLFSLPPVIVLCVCRLVTLRLRILRLDRSR